MTDTLGVAMIGYGFMGRAHSNALRQVDAAFDLPVTPEMVTMCGRDGTAVAAAAAKLGWRGHDTDVRSVLARDDVDLVIVGTPGNSHAEIALAALEAGKHVLCEKPLANTIAECEAMVTAAGAASQRGVRSMLAHNYRRIPAIEVARRMIADGRIGDVRQVRVVYLQDWLADADAPMTWRLRAELAGSGALGDIGSHIVDLAQHVIGDHLTEVTAMTATMVDERPLPDGSGTGTVTVDDVALFLGRFAGGTMASFEATRMATGRKNALRLEIHGSAGAVSWDLERLDELWVLDGDDSHNGFRRVLITEGADPWMAGWWPPGHIIGWEHTFTHQLRDLIVAIDGGSDPDPSFADGLAIQRILDAVLESARTGHRVAIQNA